MSGNPSNLQLRAAFGTQEGGPSSAWHDFRVLSEGLGLDLPTIEDESIEPNAYEPEGLETKIDPGGDFNANHGPEEHYPFYAEFQAAGNTPVESPTDVYTQILSPAESDVAFGPLLVEASRDLGRPDVLREAQVSQITWAVGPRSILNGAFTLLAPRGDTWEAATELAATATPTPPVIRGWHTYADLVAADGNVFVRVSSVSLPNVTIETKIGAAAAYSNTQVVPVDTWTNLEDEAGVLIGDDGLPVQIYLTGTYTAADEWRIDRERAVWTPSLPLRSPLNEIAATIQVDGAEFRTREFNLTATKPIERDEVIGGRFSDTILERGMRTVAGQLNRRAVDNSLINRILRAQTFTLRVDAYGAYIAATGVRRRMSLIMMNCKPSGRTPSVSNRTTFDEPFDFKAHESTDVTYPAPLSIEIVSSVADITA